MLGALARWLRAAGYDASCHDGVEDRELVLLCQENGRTLLFVPHDLEDPASHAIRRTILSSRFETRLVRAIRVVTRKSPTLKRVRVAISR